MFVSDLRHFLDVPDDAPGPTLAMASQLCSLVRAATAGPAGKSWVSALGCRRRPDHRPCTGRMVLFRPEVGTPIEWRCDACGDEGVISGWEGSYADLRRPGGRPRQGGREVPVPDHVAAALRDLRLLDTDAERVVYAARADRSGQGAILELDDEGLDELAGFVAAEANHEPDRRRQKRLDEAFNVLSDAGTA